MADDGDVWRVEHEPVGPEEVRIGVSLNGSGRGEASVLMDSREYWVVFSESGNHLLVVPLPGGKDDLAWSVGELDPDAPREFNHIALGCSDALGYLAVPGNPERIALLMKSEAGRWDRFAEIELPGDGVLVGLNPES